MRERVLLWLLLLLLSRVLLRNVLVIVASGACQRCLKMCRPHAQPVGCLHCKGRP